MVARNMLSNYYKRNKEYKKWHVVRFSYPHYNHDARRQLRQSSTEQQESDNNTEETQDQLQYHPPLESQRSRQM